MVKARSRKKNIDSQTSINVSIISSKNEEFLKNGLTRMGKLTTKVGYEEHHESKMSWWHEDRSSVFLLFFLYVLQGIPLGLAGSIPMLLAVSIWES